MNSQMYQPIIGLEVHVELVTRSKMFCGCPADHFGKKPNTQTCPVCLGLPGALPVPNKKAVEWTILLGLALDCKIPAESKFDRKNYFYPDLPKGYQISQYDQPLCVTGKLDNIRIRRVHLEEDTGKLQHATVDGENVTLIDFNRSGVPLVEIVTEPDFRSIEQVDIFLKKLQRIIRFLEISGADMEKGSMRLEPSISLRRSGEKGEPAYRVELKNINSFRFTRKALEYEIKRQTEIFEAGEKPRQQTRGWNEAHGQTVAQREKEQAHDYRYFPEPDIPPMRWNSQAIDDLRSTLPDLPDIVVKRLMKQYGIDENSANQLSETIEQARLFEECVLIAQRGVYRNANISVQVLKNWFINRKQELENKTAPQIIQRIASSMVLNPISDDHLNTIIQKVISENPKAVEDYKKGKEPALGFLVGQAMGKLKGKGTPSQIKEKIKELLS